MYHSRVVADEEIYALQVTEKPYLHRENKSHAQKTLRPNRHTQQVLDALTTVVRLQIAQIRKKKRSQTKRYESQFTDHQDAFLGL